MFIELYLLFEISKWFAQKAQNYILILNLDEMKIVFNKNCCILLKIGKMNR